MAMPGQGVWGRVRERLRRFPALLANCEEQVLVYGKCVASKTTGHGDLKKDVCAKEFQMLMECFTKAEVSGHCYVLCVAFTGFDFDSHGLDTRNVYTLQQSDPRDRKA